MRDEIIGLNWIKNIKKMKTTRFCPDRTAGLPIGIIDFRFIFFLQKDPYKKQNFAIKLLETKSNFKKCNQALYRDSDLKHPRPIHGFSHHRSFLSHQDPAIPKLDVYSCPPLSLFA